jgi:hypothetical protein
MVMRIIHQPIHSLFALLAALSLYTGSAFAQPTLQDPGVVPGLSQVDVDSKMGTPSVTVADEESQTGTLAPLAAGVVQSGGTGGTLTHDVDASATFFSARSGTAQLDYFRGDTKQFGTSIAFSGRALYRYRFTLAQPTIVKINYDLLATETPEPASGPSWWAMVGFDIEISGQHKYVNYSLPNPEPPSPVSTQGSFSVALLPGERYIEISVISSATGNQWGVDRTMSGTFHFQIGDPEPWESVGHALAGTHGEPLLVGTGSLIGGAPLTLAVSQARENTLAVGVVGFSNLNLPLLGGVLVPTPEVLLNGLATDANGNLVYGTTWPVGMPAGLDVYCQFWLLDPAGPQGFAASNGVRGSVL